MFPSGRQLLLCCAAALTIMSARAQTTLLGEFALKGSLANNVSGGPSLQLLPYSGVSGTITASGYVFGKDQGLTFTSPSLSSTNYSVEISFKTNLESTTWSKLLDISGVGANDNGLYIHNNGGYKLQYYPVSDSATTADFVAGTNFDVVLTRDGATSLVSGYVNGVLRFSFTDSSNYAVITAAGNALTFFVDDTHTGQNEVSTGTANYIRIYNGALTASDVTALYNAGAPSAVPEPATTGLLIGVAAIGGALIRRRLSR